MTTENLHQGSCHCGAVRFSVELDLSQAVNACNCSLCGRSGTLLTFVGANSFKLEQGEDALTEYRFNKNAIEHLFCKTCGVRSFSRGVSPNGPVYAVNARCLEGVDVASLNVNHVDGRSF